MSTKRIQIAIDGYSTCDKNTLARTLAEELGYTYVDSGIMYRTVVLLAMRRGLWDGEQFELDKLCEELDGVLVTFDPKAGHTLLNDEDVESEIRTLEVSRPASVMTSYDFVRAMLVAQQRRLGEAGGIVMDGRDIGTAVFPEAELKIFLTASPKVRAQRRYDELRGKGDQMTTMEMVSADLADRDYRDSHKAINPLRQAEDAVVMDNSELTIDEQTQIALQIARERE